MILGNVADLGDHLNGDLERQIKALAVARGQALECRAAVYLDSQYRLILRDVLGGGYGANGAELLEHLRAAVRAGRVFCPISESTIVELFKQSDLSSRAETARLVPMVRFSMPSERSCLAQHQDRGRHEERRAVVRCSRDPTGELRRRLRVKSNVIN